jgi:small subunit ribosomal protein S16
LAVAIRLTRVGATKRPAYRVIAIDKRRSRDGRALEILGYYDPLTDPATVQLDTDKIKAWIGNGAQPSDMVVRLMRQVEQAEHGEAKPSKATKPKPSKKAQARAAAEPEAAPATTEEAEPAAEPVSEAVETAEPAAEPVSEAVEEAPDATVEEATTDAEKAEA